MRAMALGFFDGVHTGHISVLKAAREYASKNHIPAAAVTFDRQPSNAPLICDTEERIRMLKTYASMDEVFVLSFDELKNTSWYDFLNDIIAGRFGAEFISCGIEHRFGKNAGGNTSLLSEFCSEHSISCEILPFVLDNGKKISSSDIRKLIARGNVRDAARLLGHPHSIAGTVIHGKALGRTINSPTMNILLSDVVRPAPGVYFSYVFVHGRRYRSLTNVNPESLAEIYAFDFSENVYGERIRADLLEYSRPMQKMSSLSELRARISSDRRDAEAFFSGQ